MATEAAVDYNTFALDGSIGGRWRAGTGDAGEEVKINKF